MPTPMKANVIHNNTQYQWYREMKAAQQHKTRLRATIFGEVLAAIQRYPKYEIKGDKASYHKLHLGHASLQNVGVRKVADQFNLGPKQVMRIPEPPKPDPKPVPVKVPKKEVPKPQPKVVQPVEVQKPQPVEAAPVQAAPVKAAPVQAAPAQAYPDKIEVQKFTTFNQLRACVKEYQGKIPNDKIFVLVDSSGKKKEKTFAKLIKKYEKTKAKLKAAQA